MTTKTASKNARWFREHGIQPERKKCTACGWFVKHCLKWSKEITPSDMSCRSFQRMIKTKEMQIGIFNKLYTSDYVYILDFPKEDVDDKRRRISVQGVGENFIFLEMILKEDIIPKLHDRVYIGNGYRPVIDHVKRQISYKELTKTGQEEFLKIIYKLVIVNEQRFVRFFNQSNWITRKLHVIGLLAHVNIYQQEKIIREKDNGSFISFQDIETRTGITPSVAIANRILCELNNRVKYLLFVNVFDKDLRQSKKKENKENKEKNKRYWNHKKLIRMKLIRNTI